MRVHGMVVNSAEGQLFTGEKQQIVDLYRQQMAAEFIFN
jgi:hypothetical protein